MVTQGGESVLYWKKEHLPVQSNWTTGVWKLNVTLRTPSQAVDGWLPFSSPCVSLNDLITIPSIHRTLVSLGAAAASYPIPGHYVTSLLLSFCQETVSWPGFWTSLARKSTPSFFGPVRWVLCFCFTQRERQKRPCTDTSTPEYKYYLKSFKYFERFL